MLYMKLEDDILKLAEEKKRLTTSMIKESTGVSRQYINVLINKLIAEGKLLKGGTTSDAFYVLPKNVKLITALTRISRRFNGHDLKEHEVLDDLTQQALFYVSLKDNLKAIFNYAFSEMLNNAIEHSESKAIQVEVSKDKDNLTFVVNDVGIGVFKKIMQKRGLANELEAIQDLLKGKTTTQPQAHSGEGIFFTSKVADIFKLQSFDYELIINNTIDDIFVVPLKPSKRGTKVIFTVALNSKKHISEVFKQFQSSPEIMAFDKTEVQIKLYTMGTIHVSRSQARRVMSGLDKFTSVVLDFEGVPTVGQSFADEIFRVFQGKHPNITIKATNMNDAVKFMIGRVEKSNLNLELG